VHQQSNVGDRHVYASRSRFISNSVARLFEQTAWPPVVESQEGPQSAATSASADLAARMRTMWK